MRTKPSDLMLFSTLGPSSLLVVVA